ncbi:ornithine cyclodeaminase family protein [Ornithinimicrobium cavernae]|uniref:ornithine cyclodeaminase family protein n=1 Tax=Ornithinimicrobium cavernae TaxID=2666047 RepID=UPI001379C6B9|nr:ornithine cyclodeaminase family protein [Ornithinimicrobium cavernae]
MSQPLHLVTAETFEATVGYGDAVTALEAALRDPSVTAESPLRTSTPFGSDHLLYMPARVAGTVGVKLLSVGVDNPAAGLPRIQGLYVLFDERTMAPAVVLDAVSLTNCRTAALSALAVKHLATPGSDTLAVFGTGPQAAAHALAIHEVRPLREVRVLGRSPERVSQLAEGLVAKGLPARPGSLRDLGDADIVACCTSASEPLFDSRDLRPEATVVAMGSHTPTAREVDSALVASATVVVEDRQAAMAEAGDLLLAAKDGVDPARAIDADLTELVAGLRPAAGRPRLFKSVGQGWSDVVVARLVATRLDLLPDPIPGGQS